VILGFLFGSIVAYELGLPFVPIRKKGKLPGPVITAEYQVKNMKMKRLKLEISEGIWNGRFPNSTGRFEGRTTCFTPR
jgi:adenine/guanine phosphoribosyltransferase-like PRPP-binding protein